MLLGWIAGTMAVTDPAMLPFVPTEAAAKAGAPAEVTDAVRYIAGVAGALLVLALGVLIKRRRLASAA
jgi:nitrate reductase gamma subunit